MPKKGKILKFIEVLYAISKRNGMNLTKANILEKLDIGLDEQELQSFQKLELEHCKSQKNLKMIKVLLENLMYCICSFANPKT